MFIFTACLTKIGFFFLTEIFGGLKKAAISSSQNYLSQLGLTAQSSHSNINPGETHSSEVNGYIGKSMYEGNMI